jgi:hypothetical protein
MRRLLGWLLDWLQELLLVLLGLPWSLLVF